MANQPDNVGIEETIYDTVIIGGGIAGLTAAYMLRDKKLLLLEQEDRFGGRVLSEKVHEATNNIGTQFFTVEDTSFVRLIKELEVDWVTHDPKSTLFGVYVNNKLHTDIESVLGGKAKLSALKLMSVTYRKMKIYKLPMIDPRWRKLAAKTIVEFQKGYDPDLMALVKTYMRGACVAKPERTSAGMGFVLTNDIFNTKNMGFVTGGFQKITDAMVDKLDGKAICGAGVTRVEENDGIVSTCYEKDGKEQVVKAKSAVVTVPPQAALKILPQLPDWKKEALEKVDYGPITVVSVFLKRSIPWKRLYGILSEGTIFQGMSDTTYDTEEDKNKDNPLIYNFIISIPPNEKKEIEAFLAKSDEEILELTLKDFKRIRPDATDIEKYITGTKVTRYPIGELELSPEYFLEALPDLPRPVGNIHFTGEYTEKKNFVDGASFSGMRVAAKLGSKYITSEEEIIKFAKEPKWGLLRWATIILNILLVAGGFFLPRGYGTTMSVGSLLLMGLTAAFPFYFPPNKRIYKALLSVTLGFGGIIGLLAGLNR
jgi:oxygen-dependent protoporphyrinogen oxidase